MGRATPALALLGLTLSLAGCGGRQSALRTDSKASGDIAHLWWVSFVGSAIVFSVVTLLVVLAVLRARGRRAPSQVDGRGAKGLMLFGGAVIPLVVLVAFFALILQSLPSTAQPRPGRASLRIDVVGHQWFWEVRYPRTGGDVVTANEIHIPAGQPVEVVATTDDVIHSFWVPGLNRKIDMIPAQQNRILLEAEHPGVYRGQCAEFCGYQHAKMAFLVFADPPSTFRRWLEAQAKPAQARGAGSKVFVDNCGGCHTIRGTAASGKVGPDLTHLASRRTLAAATIPNNAGYLAAWIADPQHIKPGNRMPGIDLSGAQRQALFAYLEQLK